MNLFCPMYEEAQWSLSPMNAANNVNGVGTVGRNEVYTLDKRPAAAGGAGGAGAQDRRGAATDSTTSTTRSATSRISAA